MNICELGRYFVKFPCWYFGRIYECEYEDPDYYLHGVSVYISNFREEINMSQLDKDKRTPWEREEWKA